jgi:hypothetical protein
MPEYGDCPPWNKEDEVERAEFDKEFESLEPEIGYKERHRR